MRLAMKMSAEAAGEKWEEPPRKPKKKGPSQEMDAMAMDTKGFASFL